MASLTEMFFCDGEFDTTIHWEGALTTAYVSHIMSGLTAVGHAKHHPDDAYNQELGKDLAVARAMSRLYKKYERALVRETK